MDSKSQNEVPNDAAPVQNPGPIPIGGKNKRRAWLVALVIVLAGVTAGVVALHEHNNQQKKLATQTRQQSNNPAHLDGVAVGNFPYVNACIIYTPQSQQDLFAGISQTALLESQFAEDGLPVSDMPAAGVASNCSRTFGSDTPYANTILIFTAYQFPTTAAAQKQYADYNVSQADLDKANKRFGTDLTTDYVPLTGVTNTIYSSTDHNSYTLAGNKILNFKAILGDISDGTFQQALAKALPVMVSTAQSAKPGHIVPINAAFGKTIGSSTLLSPCQFFTASDFQKATGNKDNPTNVQAHFNYASDQYFPSDTSDGWATSACSRVSYPKSTSHYQDITVELHYYKTAEEAAQNIKRKVQIHTTDSFYQQKAELVSGVGDYAAYLTPTGTSKASYLYVQKGSYVLQVHTVIVNSEDTVAVNGRPAKVDPHKYPTSSEYKKLVDLLLPKLK